MPNTVVYLSCALFLLPQGDDCEALSANVYHGGKEVHAAVCCVFALTGEDVRAVVCARNKTDGISASAWCLHLTMRPCLLLLHCGIHKTVLSGLP